MIIQSSIKNYSVHIHRDFDFWNTLTKEENTIFVIDKEVYHLYLHPLFSEISQDRIFLVEASEDKKVIETALAICEVMTELPAKKNAHLISLGGGITQDITGFAANILYRGIKWTFIPTTLLAACDSCIGGKTSLNYKTYKNLLGTFYPPNEIHICPLFFHTLTERDFESGLGEVVKFNMMSGASGLSRIENDICKLIERNDQKLNEYLLYSLEFKKDFIEQDEFDQGIRILLNFAHTFGHALESISSYRIPHGTAVAMGMIIANQISLSRKWLTQDHADRMEHVLFQIIHIDVQTITADTERILLAIRKDKKQTSNQLAAVLMFDDMKLKLVHDLQPEEVHAAVTCLFNKLKDC